MESVNPVILVTAGTAVVGLLAAVTVCRKHSAKESDIKAYSSSQASNSSTAKAPSSESAQAATTAATKKKSKPKKKSTSSGAALLQDQLADLDSDDVPSSTIPSPKISVANSKPTLKEAARDTTAKPEAPKETKPTAAKAKAQKKAANPVAAAPISAPENEEVEIAAKVNEVIAPKAAASEMIIDDFAGSYESFSTGASGFGSDDGWNVVEDKRKGKAASKPKPVAKVQEEAAPAAASEAKTAAPSEVPIVSQVQVDIKKIGAIIGTKGATLKKIQEITGVEITTPKDRDTKGETATVTVTGPASGVATATRIVNDLNTKGYAADLEGEDFTEAHIMVHPSHISDIIGKGGAIRKILQDHSGVRIGIPANVPRDQAANVKVTLAGIKGRVTETKKVIKEIIKYKHHPVTHPNFVHAEVEVPTTLYNVIIGAKGSEIRQMQNNFGVSVHIPNENSFVKNVLVVGLQKGVDSAVQHIARIMEKATRDRTAAVDVAEVWAEVHEPEESHEEWMNQYIHPSQRKGADKAPEASSSSASAVTNAPANAWGSGVITSAEGW